MCIFNLSIQHLFSLSAREQCMSKLMKNSEMFVAKSLKLDVPTAAVLVPLSSVNNIPSLLYTERSKHLKSHSGQISFPGGKTDKDEKPVETALRETFEEIGLPPQKVNIWGCAPSIPGRNCDIMITPVIGHIADLKVDDLQINTNEVTSVLTVPLETLCDPTNHYYNQYKSLVLPVFIANEYKIWGITAYITHVFLSSLLSKDIYTHDWKRKMEFKDMDSKHK